MKTWRRLASFLVLIFSVLVLVQVVLADGVDSDEIAGALPAGDGTLDGPIDFTNADDVMEKLGPVMMNSDGSMSRIANWKELTPRERKTYLKKLAKKATGNGPRLIKRDASEM